MIPVPSQSLMLLFEIVRLSVVKSWLIAIPFDAFEIPVIVLLLMVILPVEVDPELMIAIPLSEADETVLSVTTSVKASVGVARTRAAP